MRNVKPITLCVIGARGGSKGLPGKNIKPLLGKPLLSWTIEQALKCDEIDRVIVSTDCSEIANAAVKSGAEILFQRPPDLSNDDIGKWQVWQHALDSFERITGETVGVFVDLDCTSPLREVSDITNAILAYKHAKCDAVFSVCEARKNPYFNLVERVDGGFVVCKPLGDRVLRRQDAPMVYEHVASIYVLSPQYLRQSSGLLDGNVEGYLMPHERSLDVDTQFDFDIVEHLMTKKQNKSGDLDAL